MIPSTVAAGWDIGIHARIIAVGDVHADLDALLRILRGVGVIGDDGHWIGGTTNVVLIGDLNDRGPDSAATMAYVMDLENDARLNGGAVHALLGNHELLAVQGDFRYVRGVEAIAVEHFWHEGVNGLHAIFRGNSPWARWIRRRPTLLKSGTTVFVHAGLDEWILTWPPEVINATVTSWVAHFQGVAPEPDESGFWLTSETCGGPLWCDRYGVSVDVDVNSAAVNARLRYWLRALNCTRLVVGHKPTKQADFRVAAPHPIFGDRVALIDTGISRSYNGRLSALELLGETATPHYFERGGSELALTRDLRARFQREREAQSTGHAASD